MAYTYPIKKIDIDLWIAFKKKLLEEIDPETGRPISANKKLKKFIKDYVDGRIK